MCHHVHGRRADGKGDVVVGANLSAREATEAREHAYTRDHSFTMLWVLDHKGRLVGEPLLRDPPGMELS